SKPALAQASLAARENGQTLERTLVAQSVVTAQDIAQARARQYKMGVAHPLPRGAARDALAAKLPSAIAERYKALPWLRIGNRTLIAICNPSRIDGLTAALPDDLKPSYFAVVSEEDFERRFAEVHGPALARAAECRVPEAMSCRRWRDRGGAAVLATILVGLCIGAVLWPTNAIRVATALGLFITLLNISIRVLALRAVRQHKSAGGQFATIRTRKRGGLGPLPEISVMVPLHNEPDIAPALKARLARLDYPRELLDILLVVEEYDTVTRDALETADLPPWIRVVPVPDGQPRTKPRAMNYALGFARGQIVGIYDAEDAPAPDQLRRVAARFATAAPDVACLQGRLDFYNPTRNWMSRCFTIEYANWFRLVLPGISKLGLVVPLGGTTLFFRRNALEHVGGWDAHNVTEDADLGVRLARQGYKTEIIDTTTLEEANACPKAWVKQRSRWMKGYVLTWAVHTRRPLALWRDLGAKRFWGFHALFISAILNAVLMPFLWSTIIIAFGLWHP
ncbi:MAG: glycosyltransferase family 2 protein, partial [Pseudomonadota bacterium]